VPQPDTVYVGDLPYLPTGEGWLYLAVVLDLGSRAGVGWAMADHRRAELVNQALAMATCPRQPAAELMMHTDRGSQYGADSSRQLLAQHGIQPSMSRKGNCWDNAVAESLFHTLKTEWIYLEDFDTHEQAQMGVFAYIEVFYNRQRCHSANDDLAPLAYEQALKTHGSLCPEKCWHIRVRQAYVERGMEVALARTCPTGRRYRKLDGAQQAQLTVVACSAPPAGRVRRTLP
jgi:putative transposase